MKCFDKMLRFILVCFTLITSFVIVFPSPTYASKAKSSVLLIFNNQAEKYYNYKLNVIALQELHKKVDGIYTVYENESYTEKYSSESHFADEIDKLNSLSKDVNADYLVYTELMPFHISENYNIIWHTKKATATVGLRIIDKRSGKELFKSLYALDVKGSTDHFFIGNPSMAKKSLRAAMFKVCEAISLHLPL